MWAPMTALFPKARLGISEPLVSSSPCFPIPSPLCPQPSGLLKGRCPESLRGRGAGAVPWGPGQPTALLSPPLLSPVSCPPRLCLSAAPQPLCTITVTESIPWNNHIFQSAPSSLPNTMLGILTSQAPRGFSREAGALGGGPAQHPLLAGVQTTLFLEGAGELGENKDREALESVSRFSWS